MWQMARSEDSTTAFVFASRGAKSMSGLPVTAASLRAW